jgi:3-oxoacyl-[acyl-carrier-protein] synthase-3
LYSAKITALGCYTPPGVLTNQDLEQMVDTNNQWIVQRVGILQRHIAPPEIATSDMAVEAAKIALEQRGIDGSELDAILVCTVTPDMLFPSTACLVQDRLGAKRAWGFDLVAACSGFIYGLTTAAHLVSAGSHKKVLVIGSDTMSRIIDYTGHTKLGGVNRHQKIVSNKPKQTPHPLNRFRPRRRRHAD